MTQATFERVEIGSVFVDPANTRTHSARNIEIIKPRYCDVVVKRWEKLTGGKAELEVSNA